MFVWAYMCTCSCLFASLILSFACIVSPCISALAHYMHQMCSIIISLPSNPPSAHPPLPLLPFPPSSHPYFPYSPVQVMCDLFGRLGPNQQELSSGTWVQPVTLQGLQQGYKSLTHSTACAKVTRNYTRSLSYSGISLPTYGGCQQC